MAEKKKTRLTSGPVSDRILQSVYESLSIPKIIQLKTGPLVFNQDGDVAILDWYNLCYEHLDDYALLTNSSMSFYIFGSEEPAAANYTKDDAEVIGILNQLGQDRLLWLKDLIYRYHPAIRWSETKHTDPSLRFKAYLDSRKPYYSRRERPEAFLKPDYESGELHTEILRIRRMTSKGRFGTDTLTDLAIASGISIHWLLGVRLPIHCRNEFAESVFDLYTLIPQRKKDFLVQVLRELKKRGE